MFDKDIRRLRGNIQQIRKFRAESIKRPFALLPIESNNISGCDNNIQAGSNNKFQKQYFLRNPSCRHTIPSNTECTKKEIRNTKSILRFLSLIRVIVVIIYTFFKLDELTRHDVRWWLAFGVYFYPARLFAHFRASFYWHC